VKQRLLLPVLFLAGWTRAAEPDASPLPPEQALKTIAVAEGLRVELVAAEPLVASPCAMAFDERGRLFVAENRGYPNTSNPPQGIIALLEDTNSDGRMDRRTVFADGLTFPNGVLPWKGGVFVTCAPDLLYLKDTDGDGHADERSVVLTGFATKGSTQLRVNAPTLGPDGWIYLAAGLAGGEITCPAHPERPALKMTADLRFHPETLEAENVDGRSQYGMSFDDFGRRFICMNRLPVQHVVMQSRWLRRNPRFAFSDTVQDCNERSVKTGLRGGGDGVRLFPISSNITTADSHAGSFSAACGIHIWRGGSLPPSYHGCAFSCDPTANLVHVDHLAPRGATFTAEPMFNDHEFLASRDDWFRPVFLATGPDGALYICDMYRKVIEHPDYLPEEVRKRTNFESGKEMGRIWRVVATDTHTRTLSFPWLLGDAEADVETLAKLVDTDVAWDRELVSQRMIERKWTAGELAKLSQVIVEMHESAARAAVLRLLALHDALDAKTLQTAGEDESPEIREAALALWLAAPATSTARRWQPEASKLAEEADARVRFTGALALGELSSDAACKALASIAAKDAEDRWTRSAVLSGIGARAAQFRAAFLSQMSAVSAGTLNLLTEIGRLTNDGRAPLLQQSPALLDGSVRPSDAFDVTAALLVGLAEASKQRIELTPETQAFASFLATASQIALDPAVAPARRGLAVRFLGHGAWSVAKEPLLALAADAQAGDLRAAAIRGLAGFDEPEVTQTILTTGRWTGSTPELRETILASLLARPAHLPSVLNAVESGALPASALSPPRRQLFLKHKDAAIRERAAKLFGPAAGDRQKAFEDAKTALALAPHADHGREVFKTLCATCHRLDREGYALGPDLLDMRNQPKETILFHIVVPDAEVAPAFAPYVIETKDGRTLSGLLASETPASLTLRMPLAQEETILRTNVAKLEAAPGSLMPPGLEAAMSRQDLADLLAFLKGEK
jgi:putative membrane-bound dehydrogenase-like protein